MKDLLIKIILLISGIALLLIFCFILSSTVGVEGKTESYAKTAAWWLGKINFKREIEQDIIKRNVVVAVVDTGTKNYNDEFTIVAKGYNVLNNSEDTSDTHGHGTKCAQLIASKKIGVNPYATILPVKVREEMLDNPEYVSKGIIWAADNGADIISLSLGKAPTKNNMHEIYLEGVEYALKKGKLIVAASGSAGSEIFYPAAIDGVICVSALDASYNYKFDFNVDEIDIFVVDIKDNLSSSYPTAIVSGVASLIMSIDDTLSAQDAMEVILDTADVITLKNKQAKVVNVDRAIEKVVESK
ncbi:MAG: peptidase and in, kexin, sedolisin [Anaerocolumna sp.]|jgi:subtilisin family serine protease|nr:peptidase and in, kexin, sedolisin [Anaerocolumna sp.]